MITFSELTKQVHSIKDLILSDMTYCDDASEEMVIFSKHLLATKYWFARVSYANKKRYLLALLQDVRSAWTLSLLLKSIWNCRLKDAVMSQSESDNLLSTYDQVPMDNNRTALPVTTLAQTMKNDRIWFLSLSPESQALVLAELLTIAGGPAMWEVLRRARTLYERYREHMIQNVLECIVVNDAQGTKLKTTQAVTENGTQNKKEHVSTTSNAVTTEVNAGLTQAKKNLAANLAIWNTTIQAMRDRLKLEEIEMIFLDGSKRKIWKVSRTKPDIMETLDFVQLLPSSISKKILSFLPRANLSDYARVNKYWAYLVDEYRTEISARIKINADIERLNAILVKHDEALEEQVVQDELPIITSDQTCGKGQRLNKVTQSLRASEKSAVAYSFRHLTEKLNKPMVVPTPIRNMKDFYERLDKRGAADENIWKWCENVIQNTKALQKDLLKKSKKEKQDQEENLQEINKGGVLMLGDTYFSCPLMKTTLQIPLKPPLCKDPAKTKATSIKKLYHSMINLPKGAKGKHYSLWTRNLSSLYPVFKIPSYQFPSA